MKRNKTIKTKKDFSSFVLELSHDFYNNPESWENKDLGTYLAALAGWVDDMEGYYLNQGLPVPRNF